MRPKRKLNTLLWVQMRFWSDSSPTHLLCPQEIVSSHHSQSNVFFSAPNVNFLHLFRCQFASQSNANSRLESPSPISIILLHLPKRDKRRRYGAEFNGAGLQSAAPHCLPSRRIRSQSAAPVKRRKTTHQHSVRSARDGRIRTVTRAGFSHSRSVSKCPHSPGQRKKLQNVVKLVVTSARMRNRSSMMHHVCECPMRMGFQLQMKRFGVAVSLDLPGSCELTYNKRSNSGCPLESPPPRGHKSQ